MESEFDNVKELEYYNSRHIFPSDENATTKSCAMDSSQMRWKSSSDNLNNIISEEVKQTTTTTTSTDNGQFDDNLLYSSDNIDLNRKNSPQPTDDNNMHHASSQGTNGDGFLAAGYDNKYGLPSDYDNDQHKLLEKMQPHHQLLGDTEADYGPETCVDVTDDVVMMTENSADTNNLLEQSTLSHSKDTLPSSDNCNPFDNKNVLDMEDPNEFQLGSGAIDAHHQLDDANKATPLLSPEVEDLPLSSDGVLHFTNEGFQQSPLEEGVPLEIGSHQLVDEFKDDFMQSNGHLSPIDVKKTEAEKLDIAQKEEDQDDIDCLAKLEKFGDPEADKVMTAENGDQKPELIEDFFGNTPEEQKVQQKEYSFDSMEKDESDFRLKDEEEELEKHVADKDNEQSEHEVLDLSQRDQLPQSLQHLEDVILEEKPILTGYVTEKETTETNFDSMSMLPDEEKLSEYFDEKQNREEFSEKKDEEKTEEQPEKLTFVEQKSAPSEDIELEESDCIHLEEDVRPSDYLAMLERQKDEHQQLCQVVEGFEKESQFGEEEPKNLCDNNDEKSEQINEDKDDKLSSDERHEQEIQKEEEKQKKEHDENERLDEQVEQIDKNEHYDADENVSIGTEIQEHERHLDDIEIMSQQFDRFEKEDGINDQYDQPLDNESFNELMKKEQRYEDEEIEKLEELKKQLQQPEELSEKVPENNKFESEVESVEEKESPLVEDSVAQPEKQCFEEPEKMQVETEKTAEEQLPEEICNLLDQIINEDDKPIEEIDNNLNDSIGEAAQLLEECPEERLTKIEQDILDAAQILKKPVLTNVKPFNEFEEDPENLVEVEEELIVKEQVPRKSDPIPVELQEPSVVKPTHESYDDSEDDEWKYRNEGKGEKQLGLQGDTVVEEKAQPHMQEAAPIPINDREQATGNILTSQISINTSNLIESINDVSEDLIENITKLAAEKTAEAKESAEAQIAEGLQNLNLSQSSTREKLDNIEDEDISASEMNSRLNPEAKEFVPTFSPPASATGDIPNGFDLSSAPTAIPPHFINDKVLSHSPRKGRESNMEDINIPGENEFDDEISNKPHGLAEDEAIVQPTENGGDFQEMNWKEASHGSEKEEGPLIDSPVTDESLEIVDNVKQLSSASIKCELSAPVDLDNAGMKESIYIENNNSQPENDDLNTVQILPLDEGESENSSLEVLKEVNDVVTKEAVDKILDLASTETVETKVEEHIEHKMEELLKNYDNELTKDVQLEVEQVPINGIEMSPSAPEVELISITQPVAEQPHEPSAPPAEAHEGLELGAAVAVVAAATTAAAAATTAAIKKVEAEKNQKNLKKTSTTTKPKVPETKKPAAGTAAKTSTVSTAAPKRTLADKPKPATGTSLATKKTASSTTATAPRPRTAPVAGGVKTPTDKKTTTSTTTTIKSRIDAKPPTTLVNRKPLTSSSAKTTSKPAEDAKSSLTGVKTTITKTSVASKSSVGSARATSATSTITKTRPASSVATTNGTTAKTAASKPTTLAPKCATNTKSSLTSPRGTLTSTLRKTEAVKSPTKTTSSTITSRISANGTNGTKSTTTTRTTTTTKTSSSTAPTAATRTTTTSTRLSLAGTTSGATTPTSKTNSGLVPRKSTPLKRPATSTSSTPSSARKSIASKLNSSTTKPTKDTSTPRPVTIPAQHQHNNSTVVDETKNEPLALNVESILPAESSEPKLNGIVTPDDVTLSTAAPTVAHPLEMEIA